MQTIIAIVKTQHKRLHNKTESLRNTLHCVSKISKVAHLTQRLFLHYLGKLDQAKYAEINRKPEKTSPTLSIIT